MRYLIALVAVAMLAACGSTPKEQYERRAYEERQRQEKAVTSAIDQAPKWMTELPASASAVFANGSAVSTDMSMADHKAKLFAYSKICMAAGGRVSQQSKIFMMDTSEASHETSQTAIRSMCPGVDITGIETKEIRRVASGTRFRSYVLVALPTGDANVLKKRQDHMRLQAQAQSRSQQAFEELDAVTQKP